MKYAEKRPGHSGGMKTLGEVAYEACTDHQSRNYARPFTLWDELPVKDRDRWEAIGLGVAEFMNPGMIKSAKG